MNATRAQIGFTLLLFAFMTILLLLTLDLGPVARLVPMRVAVPTFLLLLLQLLLDARPSWARRYGRYVRLHAFRAEDLLQVARRRSAWGKVLDERAEREQRLLPWVLSLLAGVYLFGFLVATPFFTLLWLKVRARAGWRLSALMAAGLWGLLYGLLHHLLRARLFEGIVWHWPA